MSHRGAPPPTPRAAVKARWWWVGSAVAVAIVAVLAVVFTRSGEDDRRELSVSEPLPPSSTEATTGSAAPSAPAATSTTPAQVARPAQSQVVAARPAMLELPSSRAVDVGIAATAPDGELALPPNINRAGWWDGSALLGDPFGSIVIAAHVDSSVQGLGVFAELADVQSGDTVGLTSPRLAQSFRVISSKLVPKTTLSSASALYAAGGDHQLVLITCGGPFDELTGHYRDNRIVVAEPVGEPLAR